MALNPRQERFCQLYAKKGNASAAYREAYDGALGAAQSGYALLRNPDVSARVAELHGEAAKKHEITRDELIAWWIEVRDTPVSEVDETHPLAQEVKRGDGTVSIKMPSKETAVKELARLTGAYEPEKVAVSADADVVAMLQGIAGVRAEK